MDNFPQILCWLPLGEEYLSSSHFRVATPFKVQVQFDIPIFEGLIEAIVVDTWLNLLEGYFSVHNFSNRNNILFCSSNIPPTLRIGEKPTMSKGSRRNPHYFHLHPLGNIFETVLRNNITPLIAMKVST